MRYARQRATKKQDFFFFPLSFEYASWLINFPSKNHLHNLGAAARASCEDFYSKHHQQQLINSHILNPNCM